MDISNLNNIEVNVLEYCTVAEKTSLPADSVKVIIPKLNVSTSKGTGKAQESILVNDPECKPKVSGSIKMSDTITVKTFSGLELSKSAVITKSPCNHDGPCRGGNKTFIDGHITSAYLPKGAKMIVCFMNGNINDAYLTNFL